MYKKISVMLLTTTLVACGGEGSGASSTKIVSYPEAVNVAFENLEGDVIEIGDNLKGTYSFVSNTTPEEMDGSDLYWEIDGSSVYKGSTYRIPMDNNLVGLEIRFCVKPINRGNRAEGSKTCSTSLPIESKYVPQTPKVSIPNAATNNTVGSPLDVWVLDSSDYDTRVQWYRNEKAIQGITQQQYWLTRDDEGHQISVCAFDKKTNIKLACSAKTNAIQPRTGERPDVDITALPTKIEVGQSLYLDYDYSDRDSDKEDKSRVSFGWYLNDKKIATTRSLSLNESMAGNRVKGCVTAYAQTGLPKNSIETCTATGTVWAIKGSIPRAMNAGIEGVRFGGHKLTGVYKYYDLNNDPESGSRYEWSVIKNNVATTVSSDRTYTLQVSDEGKGNKIRFCVTPVNAKEQGNTECVTEDIAWFEGHGQLIEGGVITPHLSGYPDFKLSYWMSASKMITSAMELDFTDNKVKPVSVDKLAPSFNNLYPVSLCISLDEEIQNSDDICREVKSNVKLTAGMIFDNSDKTRVAMNYKREVKVTVSGKKYRIRRPYTWEEFKELNMDKDPGFSSAEPSIILDASNVVKGLKMTPKQANDFCLRTYGAPGVISSAINFSDGVIPGGRHQWPIYLTTQQFVTKEPDGKYVVDSNEYVPAKMDSKYAFACLAVAE